jgi:hypothetical protein
MPDSPSSSPRSSRMRRSPWVAIAIGIGVAIALGASMGPVGFAIGIGVAIAMWLALNAKR